MNEANPIIRPLTLAEILDRAFRIYRQNFLKLLGIYAIPFIPIMLIQTGSTAYLTSNMIQDPTSFLEDANLMGLGVATIAASLLLGLISFVLISGFATTAFTRAVSNAITGKSISILDSYRTISRPALTMLLALLLIGILIFGMIIWTVVPIVGWLSGPGIVFFIVLIVNPLLAPVIVLENQGVIASLRRAWDLGRSRFWWLMGFAIVLALLGQLIVTGPIYLLSGVLQSILGALPSLSMETQLALSNVASGLASMVLTLLYTPLQLTMFTVVYFDLRVRNEGLDLALQLAPASDNESGDLPEIRSTSTPLITGMDIGRFALLSLFGIGLFIAYFFVVFAILAIIGISTSGL